MYRQVSEVELINGIKKEIIIVNDGSTDNTSEILKDFGNKIIYKEQINQGQGAARNTGLKAATGEYIAFLDSDDYWLSDFLKTTVDFFHKHPEVVAVNTGYIIKKFGKAWYKKLCNTIENPTEKVAKKA